MSMESAKEFVDKFYGDDDFMIEVLKNGDTLAQITSQGKEQNTDAQSEEFVKAAKDFGYEFSAYEYDEALKAHMEKIGAWNAVKLVFHMGKIAKKIEKGKL